VRRVVEQRGSLPVELHAEIGAENRTRPGSNGGTDSRVGTLEPRDDGSVDADRSRYRSLRHADPEPQLSEVLGESIGGAAKLSVTLLDGGTSNFNLISPGHAGPPEGAGAAVRTEQLIALIGRSFGME
jgi:hypothetical protein